MIIQGDCLEQMKRLLPNSVDAVVTDPPAGISFMSKSWDSDKGGRDHWIKWLSEIMTECKRVMKPGAHAFVWAIPRTSHWTAMALEDSGFEVRDCCYHIFGSGFPKSHNLKDEWEGFGTALKPAVECWWLARKPLSESTVAKNVLKWGCGALNIDGSRIGMNGEKNPSISRYKSTPQKGNNGWEHANRGANFNPDQASLGRWPANIIFDEEAAKLLDEMSGNRPSGGGNKGNSAGVRGIFGRDAGNGFDAEYKADSGGASRFFYCAKASKSERNKGLEHEVSHKQGARPNSADPTGKFPDHDHRPTQGNGHPTVKPIKLMEYLCRLITPPGGTVLDPFMGSGSTGVAAKNLNFNFIGIEMNPEYVAIAEKRIAACAEKQMETING